MVYLLHLTFEFFLFFEEDLRLLCQFTCLLLHFLFEGILLVVKLLSLEIQLIHHLVDFYFFIVKHLLLELLPLFYFGNTSFEFLHFFFTFSQFGFFLFQQLEMKLLLLLEPLFSEPFRNDREVYQVVDTSSTVLIQ